MAPSLHHGSLTMKLLHSLQVEEKLESRSLVEVFGIIHYCPERILWEAVAKLKCPNKSINYQCLQRSEEDEYRDTCKERKVTGPGSYAVLDSITGNVDSKKCPPDRYQPRPMFSNVGNKCVYEKSVCNEEGQVVYTNGSRSEDRTCRCDYNRGYTFESSPMDSCHCKPTQEDCSCYLNTCNNTSKLNQDYTCLEEDSILSKITYSCPVIQPVFDKGNFEKDQDFYFNINDTHYNIPKRDSKNRRNAICVILLLVLIYIVTMVLFYLGNRYNRYNGHLRIKIKTEVYTEYIGSFITLMVELVENKTLTGFLFGCPDVGEIRWRKNGNNIDLSKDGDKYSISSDSKPDLSIANLHVDDEAKYTCCIKNKAGKVFCSKLITVLVLDSSAILKHIPTEVQQHGREAIHMFKKDLKTGVCEQKVMVLIIIGTKSSGKTSLWHNLLDKRPSQESKSNDILNKFYLTVKNGQWKVLDYTGRTITDFIQFKMNPEKEESKEETDKTIELIILDVPGEKEYYAAFEPFVSRKAIYLLLSDVNEELSEEKKSHTKSNLCNEREPRIHLKNNGELIRDWLDSVHSKTLAATEDPLSPLTPSVILVGTHIDKLKYSAPVEESIERYEKAVKKCVDQKRKITSKHVSHSFVLSNTNTNISELQSLKAAIINTSDKIPGEEIPVRYKMFEKILDDERNTTVLLSFDEIHQLGKESGYPVTDRREIDQFLTYQHDVNNVIYHQDIPECVIISPNWLYSVIRKLLTAFHKEDENSDYKKKGLISLDLLDRTVGDTEFKKNTNQANQDIISILTQFDVVAVAWKEDEYKETNTYYYYVPSVIPEEHTVDLVTLFESERRGKTSFLCFSFDFLPPSLVHHVMVKLLSQYSICVKNGYIALYYRTLLVNYDRYTKQRLYFLTIENELLFQIWYYGVQQISLCFQGLRKMVESTVSNYKSRHKLNIAFTYKLRCPDSRHAATDGWDILDTTKKKTFYCMDHKTNHEDLYTTWFTDSNQTVEHSLGVNRNLEFQFQRESRQRASVLGIPSIVLDNTTYKVQKGETLRLQCLIESKKSMPMVKLIWWRKVNGRDVKVPVENVMKYRNGTRTIPSLTILDVKDDDIGLYWCEAINSNGKSISETVKVNVEAERPSFIQATNNGSENQISRSNYKNKMNLTEDKTEIADTNTLKKDTFSPDERKRTGPRESPSLKKTADKEIYDAVIVCDTEDEKEADEFLQHIDKLDKEWQLDIKIGFSREILSTGGQISSHEYLFDVARYIFIFCTKMSSSEVRQRFKNECLLVNSLSDTDKVFRVIPVSVDGPECIPFELASLIPINYCNYKKTKNKGLEDKVYIRMLQRLFQTGRKEHLPI
ncbi:uncharacterized protein [Mytilus edulis]|uniref:uncharacterized protein n=1 Tax=Mytilus edulis TaxID=6550 RepID=UPI0039EEB4EA